MQFQFTGLLGQLQQRLARAEHLTLYGPRGGGKSTLLVQLRRRFERDGVPCSYAASTIGLDDITRALERAYPGVDTLNVARRCARMRLWHAAERRAGVLLLDHFHCSGTAMASFLRRLHGGIAGVLTSVDVEDATQLSRMRPWRYGAMSVRMPPASTRQLRGLLDDLWRAVKFPPLEPVAMQSLLRAARGRPGWIAQCVELACQRRYWCEHGPRVAALCVDTEAAVRYRFLAMACVEAAATPVRQRADQGSSATTGESVASGLMTPKRAGRSA